METRIAPGMTLAGAHSGRNIAVKVLITTAKFKINLRMR